jgi:GTP-binding protein LepA
MNNIRNFCIIAHIDHGKSTLADRMLEMTDTVTSRQMKEQFLDKLDLERERGITIKLQAVRMRWLAPEARDESVRELGEGLHSGTLEPSYSGNEYVFNLIDTPGHVDFAYEVSRSLAACEGALLLVDATQGIEAQTIANFYKALDHNLMIIPVVNKVDLPNAEPERRAKELCDTLGFREDEVVFTSGKSGIGVEKLFEAIVERIPAPAQALDEPLKALVFDSQFDPHQGVVAFIRVMTGTVRRESLKMMASENQFTPLAVGYNGSGFEPQTRLVAGEVGYVATGLKNISQVRVGDTLTSMTEPATEPLHGYEPVKPMVFAGLYPVNSDDYVEFRSSLEELALNDASLTYSLETSAALGFGFRVGFLGMLHLEVTEERLTQEFGLDLVATAPSVEYEITKTDGTELNLRAAADLPDPASIRQIREPWVKAELLGPKEYLGALIELCERHRGRMINTEFMEDRAILTYELPLAEIIFNFYDELKSVSQGYVSLDYTVIEYRPVEAVKLDILVNSEQVDALAQLVVRSQAERIGREVVARLKEVIPRQNFNVPLQAAIGGKIVAREDIAAFRKDVIEKLYGGDVTRKNKLLDKQKKGKKRMKMFGKVEIPQEAFLAVLKR